ncbi:hypothetical protein TthWC1_2360 [Thermoanaerobacter thermohydrosulfuricus WC1]|uniref:YqbQ/XkdQ domain-containing protein n=1 Tax=Thermoanaerobacter thermohydrosulfuricus WC1 TaxID=1198630 RepID=M8DDK2_THETY|nr:hypothetical protein [Thermoanaerobacter thermohydrosulfuricus]EMT38117.1 hypothetical protein TthWC1_2360 [Thermoanaerobacter thermohydrosulfuricus WC1]
MIDTSKIFYDLVVVLPNGDKIRLAPVLRSLSWEENDGELAVRLEAEIHNQRMKDGKWLHQKIPLGSQVVLLAEWGEGWKEIFRGTVFSWDYRTDPLGHFTITAYDQLIYLTKSKDDRYYKAGTTAKAIIQDIAKAWNIPLGTVQGPDVALSKQVFRGDSLADMIFSVLEQAKKRGAGKWIVRSKQGKIDIIRPGQNSPVYCFTADTNVGSVEERQDIEELVTRVKIVGAEDKEGRAPVVAQLSGRTEFGILQEVVYQRQYDNLAAAKSAAQEILKERGQPKKARKIVAPDLPFLRKGDKVKIVAGTLNGYYIVKSVTHNATNRTMVLEVEDVG